MDEIHVYGTASNEDRRIVEEQDKATKQDATDVEKARAERCGRRAERKMCRCGASGRPRARSRRRRRIVAQNPFIIFYLEMYYKSPGKHVTEVARQAGKEWCALPEEERKKYERLAEKERKRRGRRGRARRRGY